MKRMLALVLVLLLAIAPSAAVAAEIETAVLAGGCFWCLEHDLEHLPGVVEATSGYSGGHVDQPTYRQVSSETTGHQEVVEVRFDPARISYSTLLRSYWRNVDPLDGGGQFCDRGNSYRAAVFVENAEERAEVERQFQSIDAAGILPAPIVTQVRDEVAFYPAEKYHQNYYQKNPARYKLYRVGCGRDKRVKEVWSGEGNS